MLTTELFEWEIEPQQYHTEFNNEGEETVILFLTAPLHESQGQMKNNTVEVEENLNPKKEDSLPVEHPMFKERPDTGMVYDLKMK